MIYPMPTRADQQKEKKMNAKLTRAQKITACDNCQNVILVSDFVAGNSCLACYMVENNFTPRQFSKLLKVSLGCESCGFSSSAFALQFDHTDHATKYRTKSGKIVEPSDLFRTCSVFVFVAEVAKCVIRCANCHAIKTAKERGLE
jgi:hypothetical protein